jgi:hypothetical protein
LRCLFYWKLDTTDKLERAYSLIPADSKAFPVLLQGLEYLSQPGVLAGVLLCYLVAGLSFYHHPKVEDVEALARSKFAAIPEASLPACPIISKAFFSYLAGQVALSPYLCCTTYPSAAGFAEKAAAATFSKLNTFKNWEHMAHLKLKLGEWHCEAPNGASPAALTGDKEVVWGPPDPSAVTATAFTVDGTGPPTFFWLYNLVAMYPRASRTILDSSFSSQLHASGL